MTDQNLVNFLKAIGITHKEGMYGPLMEDNYVKFMSDRGEYDDVQCKQFRAWLDYMNTPYTVESSRSLTIDNLAALRLLRVLERLYTMSNFIGPELIELFYHTANSEKYDDVIYEWTSRGFGG